MNTNLMFSMKHRSNTSLMMPMKTYTPRNIVKPSPMINLAPTQNFDSVKPKWGEPVWFLFHTMAHKVKEENFADIKNEIFDNIINICQNLPCPKCAKHAVDYMKRVNFSAILTKEDLKKMLFLFHNNVNREKGYPIFEYENLDVKYEKAVTVNIINNFLKFYNVKDFNVNMINANFQRNMVTHKMKVWFSNNIQFFNM